MKKLKKIAYLVLSYGLVAALAIGGTIAYLKDTDEETNVMTLGNVDIVQVEQERVNFNDADEQHKLRGFTRDKPLYPAVYDGGSIPWAPEGEWVEANDQAWKVVADNANVVDKFVSVTNIGKSDAYVRTLFAIEVGEDKKADQYIHLVMNGDNIKDGPTWQWNWLVDENGKDISAIIKGETYIFCEAVYTGILKPGETTIPSLKQVYLDKEATNEVVESLGDDFKIVVLSQAIQTNGFASATAALDEGFGIPESMNKEGDYPISLAADWFRIILENSKPDTWDGTADPSFYNPEVPEDEYVIKTAEQLAAFAKLVDEGNTFEGKTVKLGRDIDLTYKDENGEATSFNPIGSYRNEQAFKGTFDGQGYTISNMSQNTWALDTGYYYGDLGLGLFAFVEDATIKNLNMDNANISGESAICGIVAAAAYGDCTFENITVANSTSHDYQYYAGGVVGWASGNHQYINCDVAESTVVGSQWGDFGNANGGLIGGVGSSATIYLKDCNIACRIDAVNDVVSAYQWYNYRNSGMIIGRVPQTIVNGEVQTVATPSNVTCENVTVTYGEWANYTYCEFAGTGYPYVRVQGGTSVDAYSNVRYGHPTDANGNEVVDDNHVHNDGEAHHELIVFDQLFGGPANHRYCYYGISEYPGVKVVYNNK